MLAGISVIPSQSSGLLFFGPPVGSTGQINAFEPVFVDVDFAHSVWLDSGQAFDVPPLPAMAISPSWD